MKAEILYGVEVAPQNVKYYGVEVVTSPKEQEPMVKIPMAWLKELMTYASETSEFTTTASVYDVKYETDEQLEKECEAVYNVINTILEKTRGFKGDED